MNNPEQPSHNQASQNHTNQNQTNQNHIQTLMSERISLVVQLTELNAQHIKAETVRAGLEIEIASLNAANSTIPSELEKLKAHYEEQLSLQKDIDAQRNDLNTKLDFIAQQLDTI